MASDQTPALLQGIVAALDRLLSVQAEAAEAAQAAQAQAAQAASFERLEALLQPLTPGGGLRPLPAAAPDPAPVAPPAAAGTGPGDAPLAEDVSPRRGRGPSAELDIPSVDIPDYPGDPFQPDSPPFQRAGALAAAPGAAPRAAPTRGASLIAQSLQPDSTSASGLQSTAGRFGGPSDDSRLGGFGVAPGRASAAPRDDPGDTPFSFRRPQLPPTEWDPGRTVRSSTSAHESEKLDGRALAQFLEGLRVTTSLKISGEADGESDPDQVLTDLRSQLAQRIAAFRGLLARTSSAEVIPSVNAIPHWLTELGQLEFALLHCRPGSSAQGLVQIRVLDARATHHSDLQRLAEELIVHDLPPQMLGKLSKPTPGVIRAIEAVRSERDSQLLGDLPQFLSNGGGVETAPFSALSVTVSRFYHLAQLMRSSPMGANDPALSNSSLVSALTEAAQRNKELLGFGKAMHDHYLRVANGYELSGALGSFPLRPGQQRLTGSLDTFFFSPSELLAVALAYIKMHASGVLSRRRAAIVDRNKSPSLSTPAARLRTALAHVVTADGDDGEADDGEADDLVDALVAALQAGGAGRHNKQPGPLSGAGGNCHLCGQLGHHFYACPLKSTPAFQAALRSFQAQSANAASIQPPAPSGAAARVMALEVFDHLQTLVREEAAAADAALPVEPSATVHLVTSLSESLDDASVLVATRRGADASRGSAVRQRRAGAAATHPPPAHPKPLAPLPQWEGPRDRGQARVPPGFPLRSLGDAGGDMGDLTDGSQQLSPVQLSRQVNSCLRTLSTATDALVQGVQEPLSALLQGILSVDKPSLPLPSAPAHLLDATISQPFFVHGLKALIRLGDGVLLDLVARGAKAMLDSGAATSFLSPRMAEYPEVNTVVDALRRPFRVSGVTPGSFVPRSALELEICLPGLAPLPHTFSLADSHQSDWDLLIGRDFLQRLRQGGISYTGDDGVEYVFPFLITGDPSPQGARPRHPALPADG